MGRSAGGVAGISLKRGDEVIAALPVAPEGELLTATVAGFVKRTRISEFGLQGRGGGGIIAHKISERSGELAAAAMLTPEHAFAVCVTMRGVAKPVALDEVPSSGRSAQGSQAVDLAQSDAVASVHAVSPVVVSLERPPPQHAPQANGKVSSATGRRASKRETDARPVEGATTRNGQATKESASRRRKRTSRASAADEKPAPNKKKRSLDSEAPKRRKPEAGKSGLSSAREKSAPQRAGAKSNAPTSKPPKRAARDGARQTATEADVNRPDQPSVSIAHKKPAANASTPQPSPSTGQTPKSAKSGDTRAEGSPKRARETEDQLVQGQLLKESPPAQASTKRKGKLDRVSSVPRKRKKT